MARFLFILFLTFLSFEPKLSAEDPSSSYTAFFHQFRQDSVLSLKSKKGYFPTLFHNLGQQAISPFHMSERGWGNTFLVAGVTATFIHFDEEIDSRIRLVKYENRFIFDVSPQVTEMGDYYGYITLAAFGGYSLLFHDYKAYRTSLLASQAAITAGLWVRAGKMLTGRMRPGAVYKDKVYTSDHWFGPFAQFDKSKYNGRGIAGFDAFPSGHTAAAFAMATVFAREYRETPVIPVFMYSLAGIVGVTRLIEHEHYASDVFLGAVTGYLCARQVIRTEDKLFDRKQRKRRSYAQIAPYYQQGFGGFTLCVQY